MNRVRRMRATGLLTLAVAAVVGGTFMLGRAVDIYLTPDDPAAVIAAPTAEPPANDATPRLPARRPGVPVTQPITGQNRPPLPEDGNGPFGSRMTTGLPYIALTFDDGPDPEYTPQVLAALRYYQIKATFCMVGENAQLYPQLVRAIAAEGHTLCNHTWNHDLDLGKRDVASIYSDMARTNEAILAAVPGGRVSYFRHPGGNWTQLAVDVARFMGMSSLHWTVDPQDWTVPGGGSIAATVTAGAHPGAIVLLHDAGGNRQGTVASLQTILPNLGRRFLLAALPPGIDQPRRFGLEMPLHPGQV